MILSPKPRRLRAGADSTGANAHICGFCRALSFLIAHGVTSVHSSLRNLRAKLRHISVYPLHPMVASYTDAVVAI
jgi:hypothetical protein